MPKFVLKEMDSLYVDEMRSSINQLMLNLESQPVSKGGADSKYGLQKLKKYNHRLESIQTSPKQDSLNCCSTKNTAKKRNNQQTSSTLLLSLSRGIFYTKLF